MKKLMDEYGMAALYFFIGMMFIGAFAVLINTFCT